MPAEKQQRNEENNANALLKEAQDNLALYNKAEEFLLPFSEQEHQQLELDLQTIREHVKRLYWIKNKKELANSKESYDIDHQHYQDVKKDFSKLLAKSIKKMLIETQATRQAIVERLKRELQAGEKPYFESNPELQDVDQKYKKLKTIETMMKDQLDQASKEFFALVDSTISEVNSSEKHDQFKELISARDNYFLQSKYLNESTQKYNKKLQQMQEAEKDYQEYQEKKFKRLEILFTQKIELFKNENPDDINSVEALHRKLQNEGENVVKEAIEQDEIAEAKSLDEISREYNDAFNTHNKLIKREAVWILHEQFIKPYLNLKVMFEKPSFWATNRENVIREDNPHKLKVLDSVHDGWERHGKFAHLTSNALWMTSQRLLSYEKSTIDLSDNAALTQPLMSKEEIEQEKQLIANAMFKRLTLIKDFNTDEPLENAIQRLMDANILKRKPYYKRPRSVVMTDMTNFYDFIKSHGDSDVKKALENSFAIDTETKKLVALQPKYLPLAAHFKNNSLAHAPLPIVTENMKSNWKIFNSDIWLTLSQQIADLENKKELTRSLIKQSIRNVKLLKELEKEIEDQQNKILTQQITLLANGISSLSGEKKINKAVNDIHYREQLEQVLNYFEQQSLRFATQETNTQFDKVKSQTINLLNQLKERQTSFFDIKKETITRNEWLRELHKNNFWSQLTQPLSDEVRSLETEAANEELLANKAWREAEILQSQNKDASMLLNKWEQHRALNREKLAETKRPIRTFEKIQNVQEEWNTVKNFADLTTEDLITQAVQLISLKEEKEKRNQETTKEWVQLSLIATALSKRLELMSKNSEFRDDVSADLFDKLQQIGIIPKHVTLKHKWAPVPISANSVVYAINLINDYGNQATKSNAEKAIKTLGVIVKKSYDNRAFIVPSELVHSVPTRKASRIFPRISRSQIWREDFLKNREALFLEVAQAIQINTHIQEGQPSSSHPLLVLSGMRSKLSVAFKVSQDDRPPTSWFSFLRRFRNDARNENIKLQWTRYVNHKKRDLLEKQLQVFKNWVGIYTTGNADGNPLLEYAATPTMEKIVTNSLKELEKAGYGRDLVDIKTKFTNYVQQAKKIREEAISYLEDLTSYNEQPLNEDKLDNLIISFWGNLNKESRIKFLNEQKDNILKLPKVLAARFKSNSPGQEKFSQDQLNQLKQCFAWLKSIQHLMKDETLRGEITQAVNAIITNYCETPLFFFWKNDNPEHLDQYEAYLQELAKTYYSNGIDQLEIIKKQREHLAKHKIISFLEEYKKFESTLSKDVDSNVNQSHNFKSFAMNRWDPAKFKELDELLSSHTDKADMKSLTSHDVWERMLAAQLHLAEQRKILAVNDTALTEDIKNFITGNNQLLESWETFLIEQQAALLGKQMGYLSRFIRNYVTAALQQGQSENDIRKDLDVEQLNIQLKSVQNNVGNDFNVYAVFESMIDNTIRNYHNTLEVVATKQAVNENINGEQASLERSSINLTSAIALEEVLADLSSPTQMPSLVAAQAKRQDLQPDLENTRHWKIVLADKIQKLVSDLESIAKNTTITPEACESAFNRILQIQADLFNSRNNAFAIHSDKWRKYIKANRLALLEHEKTILDKWSKSFFTEDSRLKAPASITPDLFNALNKATDFFQETANELLVDSNTYFPFLEKNIMPRLLQLHLVSDLNRLLNLDLTSLEYGIDITNMSTWKDMVERQKTIVENRKNIAVADQKGFLEEQQHALLVKQMEVFNGWLNNLVKKITDENTSITDDTVIDTLSLFDQLKEYHNTLDKGIDVYQSLNNMIDTAIMQYMMMFSPKTNGRQPYINMKAAQLIEKLLSEFSLPEHAQRLAEVHKLRLRHAIAQDNAKVVDLEATTEIDLMLKIEQAKNINETSYHQRFDDLTAALKAIDAKQKSLKSSDKKQYQHTAWSNYLTEQYAEIKPRYNQALRAKVLLDLSKIFNKDRFLSTKTINIPQFELDFFSNMNKNDHAELKQIYEVLAESVITALKKLFNTQAGLDSTNPEVINKLKMCCKILANCGYSDINKKVQQWVQKNSSDCIRNYYIDISSIDVTNIKRDQHDKIVQTLMEHEALLEVVAPDQGSNIKVAVQHRKNIFDPKRDADNRQTFLSEYDCYTQMIGKLDLTKFSDAMTLATTWKHELFNSINLLLDTEPKEFTDLSLWNQLSTALNDLQNEQADFALKYKPSSDRKSIDAKWHAFLSKLSVMLVKKQVDAFEALLDYTYQQLQAAIDMKPYDEAMKSLEKSSETLQTLINQFSDLRSLYLSNDKETSEKVQSLIPKALTIHFQSLTMLSEKIKEISRPGHYEEVDQEKSKVKFFRHSQALLSAFVKVAESHVNEHFYRSYEKLIADSSELISKIKPASVVQPGTNKDVREISSPDSMQRNTPNASS